MSNPDSYGWGPGWPHCQTDKLLTIQMSSGLRLPVRRELGGLVAWLCAETERRGYDIRTGETWTFACRAVRGYNVASFHSWAMAVDINAPANPMLHGSPGWRWLHDHGRTDMPEWLPQLWKAHMFEWGGDYPSRQDAMHFGFRGTPADAARVTAGLGSVSHPSPTVLVLDHTLKIGSSGAIVHHVQDLLHWIATRYKEPAVDTKADGQFGPKTAAAVTAFKTSIYKLETAFHAHLTFHKPLEGMVGPVTLGALEFWASAK